jgi:hypothetical protein
VNVRRYLPDLEKLAVCRITGGSVIFVRLRDTARFRSRTTTTAAAITVSAVNAPFVPPIKHEDE